MQKILPLCTLHLPNTTNPKHLQESEETRLNGHIWHKWDSETGTRCLKHWEPLFTVQLTAYLKRIVPTP